MKSMRRSGGEGVGAVCLYLPPRRSHSLLYVLTVSHCRSRGLRCQTNLFKSHDRSFVATDSHRKSSGQNSHLNATHMNTIHHAAYAAGAPCVAAGSADAPGVAAAAAFAAAGAAVVAVVAPRAAAVAAAATVAAAALEAQAE